MHFTLGEGMECLKSIIDHDTIVCFLRSFLMFFTGFVVKTRIAFSPFQQGVHPLPKLEKLLFFLNNLKRSFF